MLPKPKYLGPDHAASFQDHSVVEAYQYRPPYPEEVFTVLAGLLEDEPRTVLDVGCGRGDLARRLVRSVARVDAIDISSPMIQVGQTLPNGNHPHLNWIQGRVEDTLLFPPYTLITAGQSLHWMEWDMVLPRFFDMLTPNGKLAIVDSDALTASWQEDLFKIIRRYSTNPDYQPVNLVHELEIRGLFQPLGEVETLPVPFVQSVEEYIESFHGRSSFSRERMTKELAATIDNEIRELVSPYCVSGKVTFQVVGSVVWGRPTKKGI